MPDIRELIVNNRCTYHQDNGNNELKNDQATS